MSTTHRIVFVDAPILRVKAVSFDEAEGLVKLEGRDGRGNIKVWARHNERQKFRQVGAMKYDLAIYFKKVMLADDRERRKALRDAKHCVWDQ